MDDTAREVIGNDADFDAGWDDAPPAPAAETAAEEPAPEDAGEAAPAPAEGTAPADAPSEPQNEPTAAQEPETGTNTTPAPETAPAAPEAPQDEVQLTYSGGMRTVSREEALALAGRGLDYDQVVQERDELRREVEALGGLEGLRSYAEFIREMAQTGGVTAEELMDNARAGVIARRDKVDMPVALERARLQRTQAALERREAREKAEQERVTQGEARQREDFAAFIKAYPGVQPKDIPPQVWAAVKSGEALVSAYARHTAAAAQAEVEKLKAQVAALQRNEVNKQKAAPSQATAGNSSKGVDAFDEGWGIFD